MFNAQCSIALKIFSVTVLELQTRATGTGVITSRQFLGTHGLNRLAVTGVTRSCLLLSGIRKLTT